nr:MAG TPA: hypothetical protein [Caudoviricetes sp.]
MSDYPVEGVPEEVFNQVTYFLGIARREENHYISADEQALISSRIKAAYKDLENTTGVNWLESETDNFYIALDVVCSKVFFKYYNNRDDAKNTDHLKSSIAADTFKLRWTQEAVEKRRQSNGS